MTEFLNTLVTSVASAAVVAAGIIYLTKTWLTERIKNQIKHEYDQKLETHKAELKAQSDVTIEQLKADLHRTATEHAIRFGKWHEKEAEVIAKTYGLLQEVHQCLLRYTSLIEYDSTPSKPERRQDVAAAMEKFDEYYRPNKLFIAQNTQSIIDELHTMFYQATREFMVSVESADFPRSDSADKWTNIWNKLTQEGAKGLVTLENDFRRLLRGDQLTSEGGELSPPRLSVNRRTASARLESEGS